MATEGALLGQADKGGPVCLAEESFQVRADTYTLTAHTHTHTDTPALNAPPSLSSIGRRLGWGYRLNGRSGFSSSTFSCAHSMLMTGLHKDRRNSNSANGGRLYSAYKVGQEVDMSGLEPLYADAVTLMEKLSPAQHQFFLDACKYYNSLVTAEEAAFSKAGPQTPKRAAAFHRSKPVIPCGALPNNGVSLNYSNPLHQDSDLATMCIVCRECDESPHVTAAT